MLPHVAALWLALPGHFSVLVDRLGHPDFREREAAARRLDVLGESVLPVLRKATTSPNPEVARRAAALVAVVTKRADAARTLAPTLVELTPGERPLADVLAELRKQSEYPIRAPDDDSVVVHIPATVGPVSFWAAVELLRGFEVSARDLPQLAIVPRPRPANPACVSGAVRVEVPPFPEAALPNVPADTLPLMLQCYPEPKLPWERVERVRVTKATDADGRELLAVAANPEEPVRVYPSGRGRRPFDPIPMPNLVPEHRPDLSTSDFAPNPGQGFVRLKSAVPGTRSLRVFEGVVRGVVRTGVEELAAVSGSDGSAVGANGVGLKVGEIPAPEGVTAGIALQVVVRYNSADVKLDSPLEMAETVVLQARGRGRVVVRRVSGIDLGPGPFNDGVAKPVLHGLAVADEAGRSFLVTAHGTTRELTPDGWTTDTVQLVVRPTAKDQGKPAKVTFSATRAKVVEVPFKFRDVPVVAGLGS